MLLPGDSMQRILAYPVLVIPPVQASASVLAVLGEPTIVTSERFLVMLFRVMCHLEMVRIVLAYDARQEYVGCPFAPVFRAVNVLPFLTAVSWGVPWFRVLLRVRDLDISQIARQVLRWTAGGSDSEARQRGEEPL